MLESGATLGPAMLTVLRDFIPGTPQFLTFDDQVNDGGTIKDAAIEHFDIK